MEFVRRKTIHVTPPVNLHGDDDSLFYPGEFDLLPLKTRYCKNILVTAGGLCFKNEKLITESTQSYPEQLAIFAQSGLLELRNKPTLTLSGSGQYLFVHHPWSANYYHWLTESIPRIWQVKKELASLTLVLPEYLTRLSFIADSLATFRFKEILSFPSTHNIRVSNAVIPEMKTTCYSYNPTVVRQVSEHFIKAAGQTGGDDIQYAYVSRGKDQRREIVNEEEVIEKLKEFRIAIIDIKALPFLRQVALSERLRLIISNGSGLTNMLFMRKGSTVIELHKQLTNINDFHDKVIWHLASVLKLNYMHQECQPVDRNTDMYRADLRVDIRELEKNLVFFFKYLNEQSGIHR